jgi:hypothetical protein
LPPTTTANGTIVYRTSPRLTEQAAPGGIFTIGEYGFHEYEGMVNMAPDADADPYKGRSNTVAPGKTLYIPLLTNSADVWSRRLGLGHQVGRCKKRHRPGQLYSR